MDRLSLAAKWLDPHLGRMEKAEQLHEFISGIERDAYKRGLEAAFKAILEAVENAAEIYGVAIERKSLEHIDAFLEAATTRKRTPRQGSEQARVFDVIRQRNIGWRGVEIVTELAKSERPIHERTMRTSIRRLKKAGLIEQRGDGRWYATDPQGATPTHPLPLPEISVDHNMQDDAIE
jgi:hypothetical protein